MPIMSKNCRTFVVEKEKRTNNFIYKQPKFN